MKVTSTQMMIGGLAFMVIAALIFAVYLFWPTKKSDDQ